MRYNGMLGFVTEDGEIICHTTMKGLVSTISTECAYEESLPDAVHKAIDYAQQVGAPANSINYIVGETIRKWKYGNYQIAISTINYLIFFKKFYIIILEKFKGVKKLLIILISFYINLYFLLCCQAVYLVQLQILQTTDHSIKSMPAVQEQSIRLALVSVYIC